MINFRMLFRSLVPGLEGDSAEVDAVDEKLQGFGVEFDAALAGSLGEGQLKRPFSRRFAATQRPVPSK